MPTLPKYTLRIPKNLLDKLHYISEYNARSTNKEIEFLIRNHVEQFEKKHGTISLEEK